MSFLSKLIEGARNINIDIDDGVRHVFELRERYDVDLRSWSDVMWMKEFLRERWEAHEEEMKTRLVADGIDVDKVSETEKHWHERCGFALDAGEPEPPMPEPVKEAWDIKEEIQKKSLEGWTPPKECFWCQVEH